ncbi:eukaryotic membrane protein family-domain-containing protein [Kalaharituber pfeilii]|nr:eukaryotic membrane protein family-domain-containing protein [Kalaharituber pfeilii]
MAEAAAPPALDPAQQQPTKELSGPPLTASTHSRQPSDAASVASSRGSWTSVTPDGDSTGIVEDVSRRGSGVVGIQHRVKEDTDTHPLPPLQLKDRNLAHGLEKECTGSIADPLVEAPATFLAQEDGAEETKAKDEGSEACIQNGLKMTSIEEPSGRIPAAEETSIPGTDGEGRGRSTENHHNAASPQAQETRDLQLTRAIIARHRTVSSPPLRRRSKSTLTISTTTHSKPVNSAHSRRQPTIENLGEKQARPSTIATNTTEPQRQSINLSSPANPSSKRPMETPSTSLPKTPQGKSLSQKPSAPFPQLPIQTYLHYTLASPETPSTSQPSLGPAPELKMKYPYVPSDSPDLILERITNFFFLPPYLEKVLLFGVLVCLDSWLYTFTILPIRFVRALGMLVAYWFEALASFWKGGNRLQKRKRKLSDVSGSGSNSAMSTSTSATTPIKRQEWEKVRRRERERKISTLLPQHKADLLKGAVVVISCLVLMRYDASRMYHSIRGQAAIKLYVIYNVLEVGDRLLSALGQDIFECLFSKDTLERKPNGRSKVWRPFWCFVLAAAYNIIHSTCLFYQMITLNVAVNSYSNALLTLLLSNQFVEIKSTVFKKFEKENLFQITCADVVERFQLWLMLLIIMSRNLVEAGFETSSEMFHSSNIPGDVGANGIGGGAGMPSSSGGVVTPRVFMIFPSWAGQILGPFLMVLGSETLVDWLKHAYITKFNQIRPRIYERFLDVLCRDYYSYAFADQNLTRRFGLPVIPLACLFIRASLQTWQMFLETRAPIPHFPPPPSSSPTTSLQGGHVTGGTPLQRTGWMPTTELADTIITSTTTLVTILVLFFVFLALKLVLGICMVGYARTRYKGMKEREKEDVLTGGRRVGGFSVVEVDEGRGGIFMGMIRRASRG